jgi:hypothetical protein
MLIAEGMAGHGRAEQGIAGGEVIQGDAIPLDGRIPQQANCNSVIALSPKPRLPKEPSSLLPGLTRCIHA